jgi:hypothetical protein
MDYLKNNHNISFLALYHNSEVPASSNYYSHPSDRPPKEGRQFIQDINNNLTMTVPGQLESISQPDQGTAVLSEYKNYSADVEQQARLDKPLMNTFKMPALARGFPTPPNSYCAVPGESEARSDVFGIEQRPFLIICGKDANREINIFLCFYLCSETA